MLGQPGRAETPAVNFDLPLWAGLESLVLTLPMILWLRRAIAGPSAVQAVQQA